MSRSIHITVWKIYRWAHDIIELTVISTFKITTSISSYYLLRALNRNNITGDSKKSNSAATGTRRTRLAASYFHYSGPRRSWGKARPCERSLLYAHVSVCVHNSAHLQCTHMYTTLPLWTTSDTSALSQTILTFEISDLTNTKTALTVAGIGSQTQHIQELHKYC